MKRVGEIMIPLEEYPWVRIGDTLKRAIEVMEGAELEVGVRRSLPRVLLVFDDHDDLAGIVRRRDIMRGLEPDFLVSQPLEERVRLFDMGTGPLLSELASEVSMDRVVQGLQAQSRRMVSDVLRPIPTTLGPGDQIMKAVYEMVSLNQSLIPVEDGEVVVGVVRSVDVLHELARLIDCA
jgi:CBS domain-containing protein